MPASSMFARFALAVAVGFVGAYPFSTASGLAHLEKNPSSSSMQSVLTFFAGIILFSLTLGLAGPAIRLIARVTDRLGRVETRPSPQVAFMMMTFGVTCAIASLLVQGNASNRPPSGLTMNLNGGTQMVATQADGGSFVLGLLSVLTFLLGASLIGLGIWASIKPGPAAITAPLVKPTVPEYEAAMA
jgi:hypothetical protein